MTRAALALGAALLGIAFLFALGLLIAFPVMWLWNYTVVDLFKVPALDFWHALALFVLASILFKDRNEVVTLRVRSEN